MDDDEDHNDSSDTPIACVIQQEVACENTAFKGFSSDFCVSADALVDEDGQFFPTSDTDNVWAYQSSGEGWGDILPA